MKPKTWWSIVTVGLGLVACGTLISLRFRTPHHVKMVEQLAAQMGPEPVRPEWTPGSSVDAPTDRQVAELAVHIGVHRPVSEEDGRWILRMIESHPDPSVRVAMLTMSVKVFSKGRPGELRESEVTQQTRDAIAAHLLRALHEGSRQERFYAGTAVCIGRLWRDDVLFREGIEVLRTYGDDSFRRSFEPCFEEIDRVEGRVRN